MTTIILAGSNKWFLETKASVHSYFKKNGFDVFDVCQMYRQLQSDIAVEAKIKNIEDQKIIYIVTHTFDPSVTNKSNNEFYIGTRSLLLIQFGFDHKIDVFLSSEVKDMEDVQEKISAITPPNVIVNAFKK